MSVPLDLRDALFRAFSAGLAGSARDFTAALPKDGGPYVAERAPRFERVLATWAGRPPRTTEAALRLGADLFNAGLFFDCHEYLEGVWKRAPDADRPVLQGMIQAGAAMHKLELDPGARDGALYLLDRSLEKLGTAWPADRLAPIVEIRSRLARAALALSDLPEIL